MNQMGPGSKWRLVLWIGAALFASGLFHLGWAVITGADWSGPVSLRKPALFGLSAGVTVWSIVWVLSRLVPQRNDRLFALGLSSGLLVEVGLITLQYWRGVPSHFNRTTTVDATIESIMLGLIVLVTIGIAYLCWRSRRILPISEAEVVALRAGLWLLLVSCGLGLVITVAGEVNLRNGQPPEVWGRAGVLKYPHGATLHAIQTLPLLAILLNRLRIRHAANLLRATVAAHVVFLGHALWQTMNGRGRTDVDLIGAVPLIVAGLLLLPVVVAMLGLVGRWMRLACEWATSSRSNSRRSAT